MTVAIAIAKAGSLLVGVLRTSDLEGSLAMASQKRFRRQKIILHDLSKRTAVAVD